MHWSRRCQRRFRWVDEVESVMDAPPKGQSIVDFRNIHVVPVKRVIKIIFVGRMDRQRLTSLCLVFTFPGSMWTCWFDSDHASDHSVLLFHVQLVCELCWFDSDHASDHSVLLSHFQDVCELVDLSLTRHLTILSYFLMSSLYVNLLIWLWPCIWPFCLAFSFPGSIWTCWCDSDYASDHSILVSHF